jgi:hypothetical protein
MQLIEQSFTRQSHDRRSTHYPGQQEPRQQAKDEGRLENEEREQTKLPQQQATEEKEEPSEKLLP